MNAAYEAEDGTNVINHISIFSSLIVPTPLPHTLFLINGLKWNCFISVFMIFRFDDGSFIKKSSAISELL